MICDNCGEVFEDVENEITCPVCGVLQNITQTQTDFFSGYYAQSKRAGRLTESSENLELIGGFKDDKGAKSLKQKTDEKLIHQKIESLKQKEMCIIIGLQEILMNICKIMIIKYEIVSLVESHSKYLWKLYLIHYFNSIDESVYETTGYERKTDENYSVLNTAYESNSKVDVSEPQEDVELSGMEDSITQNRELVETQRRIRKLEREGINIIVVIILMSMNRYRYGMVCSDMYRLILQGRIPLRSVNRLLSKEIVSKLHKTFIYHGPKGKMSRSLQEDYCTNVFTNTIHPKSVDALKVTLNYYMNNILITSGIGDDCRNGDKKVARSDYELNIRVLCRRIINYTRLPNMVIVIMDKLINYLDSYEKSSNKKVSEAKINDDKELDGQIYGRILGYPKNIISCAIILISCRIIWPIFHTQPPEHAKKKVKISGKVASEKNGINSNNEANSTTESVRNNSKITETLTNRPEIVEIKKNTRRITSNNKNKSTLIRKKSEDVEKEKRKVKIIETNEKRIYHERKSNIWKLRNDEEGDTTVGAVDSVSIVSKSGRCGSSTDENNEKLTMKKLEGLGSVRRYGYVKAYLNMLYYYYRRMKGRVDEEELRKELRRELNSESDIERFKKYTLKSYKNTNFSSFLSSIIYRYTTNHFLLFKLLSIFNKKGNCADGIEDSTDNKKNDEEINGYLNLMGASSNDKYKHLMDYFGISSIEYVTTNNTDTTNLNELDESNDSDSGSTNTKGNITASSGKLFNLIRDNVVGNCEIFYLITSLFKNYPNYSGFSLEKSLEFSHFILATNDQKRQIMNMVKEIKLVSIVQKYNNVYTNITNQLLKYSEMLPSDESSEIQSNKKRKYANNISSSEGVSAYVNKNTHEQTYNETHRDKNTDTENDKHYENNTCNLYEHELERLENMFQELGKITEIGYTLPPKPFNLKNKSYQGLPVVYLLLLKTVSNFVGVPHYRVHQCVVEVENLLISELS